MKEKEDEVFEVRDVRGNFLWIDNEVIDQHSKKIGALALAVYAVLCRHADNKTGTCFPSQCLIAEKLSISIPTVRKSIKALLDAGLIEFRRDGAGCMAKTIYTVLPVKKTQKVTNKLIGNVENHSPDLPIEYYPTFPLIPPDVSTNKTQLTRLSNNPPPSAENLVLLPSSNDERTPFIQCKEMLLKCCKYLVPEVEPTWDVSDSATLSKFLHSNIKPTVEQFREWLWNYADSQNINPAARPRKIISTLTSYRSGPLNEYGRPLVEKKRRVL